MKLKDTVVVELTNEGFEIYSKYYYTKEQQLVHPQDCYIMTLKELMVIFGQHIAYRELFKNNEVRTF